jgi:hypothetical protein
VVLALAMAIAGSLVPALRALGVDAVTVRRAAEDVRGGPASTGPKNRKPYARVARTAERNSPDRIMCAVMLAR